MKKVKPNLRKMFNFHTIILVVLVIVVTKLHTHTSEGKLQRLHKHHHNHNNYKHHNAVDIAEANDDADKQQTSHGHHNNQQQQQEQQQQQQQHEHEPHHQHFHFHSHSHSQNHNHHHQRHYDGTTPSLEFTTSSSSSPSSLSSYSSSSVAISSDNEFLIKQHEEQPLTNNNNKNDEIHYKTKDLQSSEGTTHHTATRVTSATTSTTSNPSLSIHVTKENVHYLKASSLNSTSTHAETLPNSIREHTHHSHSNRLISTPLTTPEGNSGNDSNHATDNFATMYSAATGLEYKNSNWKLATNKAKDTQINEPSIAQEKQNQNRNHNEANNEKQGPPPSQQNYEDYYAEDDDVDDDGDDDYGEDEGDNDGISYDDDNNLSDRSYARITRSKLDDDYIDDEPYRSGINELSMQRDAAPGVLTEQKYLDVGNEKAVQQARERYIQDQKRPRTPHELATEHWHRMIQATKCRKPLPRVIPVSNNTSKRYEPYATILHRCGDDTGCCGSTASVCTVKRHEIVMVYVFSYDFNYRKEIEALPMQNHTECYCVNRGSLLHDSMPRDKRSGGSISYLHHFQRQQRKLQQQQQYRDLESPAYSQQQFHHQQQLQHTLDCHCPRHFNVFEEDVERHVHLPKPHTVFIRKCRCDCLLNNQTCLRFKHGEEGFSLEDRKCILEHDCKPPVCLYGDYNLRVGRCPGYRSHQLQTT